MKKLYKSLLILSVITVIGGLCAYAADYTKFSSGFVKNMKDCDKYEETVTSEFEGTKFTTTRNIIGWRNGMCHYKETISSPKETYRLNCKFSQLQVDELYRAMKSNPRVVERKELEIFTEQIDPKTKEKYYKATSTTSVKGNKADITWAKFQNNPYFCFPEKISK